MCCRGKEVKDVSMQAGKWGDYQCDLPYWTLKKINLTQGEPDFVIWTGDNVAHDVEKTPYDAVRPTLMITDFIKENFPNTVVFPIHGNHEFSPMNLQDMSLGEKDEQIRLMAEAWKDWLSPEAYDQFRKKSYYDMLISDHPLASEELKQKMHGV